MKKFELDRVYEARSICDSNCKWVAQLVKRTEKFVTLYVADVGEKRCKVNVDTEGNEFVFFLGRYSMAPIMRA